MKCYFQSRLPQLLLLFSIITVTAAQDVCGTNGNILLLRKHVRYFQNRIMKATFRSPRFIPATMKTAYSVTNSELVKIERDTCLNESFVEMEREFIAAAEQFNVFNRAVFNIAYETHRTNAKTLIDAEIDILSLSTGKIQAALRNYLLYLQTMDLDSLSLNVCSRKNEKAKKLRACVTEFSCSGQRQVCPHSGFSCVCKRKDMFRSVDEDGQPCGTVQTCINAVSNFNPLECGKTYIEPETSELQKIVNGDLATPYSWPWQARIQRVCGAIIVHERAVLTAGHCAPLIDIAKMKVRVGAFKGNGRSEKTLQEISIQSIITHPNYNPYTFDSDISMIILKERININPVKVPVCLPTTPAVAGTNCYVTGWGKKKFGAIFQSPFLMQVRLPLLTDDVCESLYLNANNDTMICAGRLDGGDSCQGDSGGPLVCQKDDGTWDLHGIVSFGQGCGQKPGAYTRVFSFVDWIADTIAAAGV